MAPTLRRAGRLAKAAKLRPKALGVGLARRNADLQPGVVFLPKGIWSHNTLSGTTGNALVPDTLADLGGGACFNDARVEVERIS